jgi:hypothetical protein
MRIYTVNLSFCAYGHGYSIPHSEIVHASSMAGAVAKAVRTARKRYGGRIREKEGSSVDLKVIIQSLVATNDDAQPGETEE